MHFPPDGIRGTLTREPACGDRWTRRRTEDARRATRRPRDRRRATTEPRPGQSQKSVAFAIGAPRSASGDRRPNGAPPLPSAVRLHRSTAPEEHRDHRRAKGKPSDDHRRQSLRRTSVERSPNCCRTTAAAACPGDAGPTSPQRTTPREVRAITAKTDGGGHCIRVTITTRTRHGSY